MGLHIQADQVSASYVSNSVFTDKGSLVAASGSATPADLPVGSDGQVLVADSGETVGVRWGDPSALQFDSSVLRSLPEPIEAGEKLLKQAVWWIDSAHSSADGQSVQNLGWGGTALNAQLGSAAGADSNDPKFLDWDGENYVYLPGVAGNRLIVPDEAALDITGDIDIRVKMALDDWTPAAFTGILHKASSGNEAFRIRLTNTGTLQFTWWSSTSATTVTSTASVPANDGEPVWVRVTHDVNNGASGNDVKFFSSTDGVSWSQIGSTVTTAGTTSIDSTSSSVIIGEYPLAANSAPAAKVYRAQVFDGIDGTKVLDVDTSVVSGDSTSFTALTGQTVTVNRSTSGRKTVCVTHPVWLFGTDDYMEVSDNALIDFGASDSFTVLAVVRRFGSSSFGIYKAGGQTGSTVGWVIYNDSRRLRDGANTVSDSAPAIVAGDASVVSFVVDRNTNQLTSYTNDSASSPTSISSVGDSSNANNLLVGGVNSTGDMEFIAAAIFRRALTSAEITTLSNYFSGRIA